MAIMLSAFLPVSACCHPLLFFAWMLTWPLVHGRPRQSLSAAPSASRDGRHPPFTRDPSSLCPTALSVPVAPFVHLHLSLAP